MEVYENMQETRAAFLIVGKQSHAGDVVQSGWVIMQLLIDLSTKARHPDHWVKPDGELWADMAC